jgi:hypothetical protein
MQHNDPICLSPFPDSGGVLMHRFLLVSLALPLAAMALGADKPGEQSGTKSAPNLNLDGL